MEKNAKSMDGHTIKNTLPQAEAVLEDMKAKGNEYWEKAKEKGKSLWSGTQSNSQKTWDKSRALIQKHPVKSVGVAVLLGVVVGMLFSSKGQD